MQEERTIIEDLVEKMIDTGIEQTIIIDNRKLDLEWWDDGKREGVVANYFEEDYERYLNYSSTGVFFIDEEGWKEEFIAAIEFIVDYR